MSDVICEGWWEQSGYGRQLMEPLQLRFQDDGVVGAGADIIGPFHISGRVAGGNVSLTKTYIDAHSVDYFGTYDGEGTLQGAWSIFGVGGKWLIRIVGAQTPTEIVDL